VNVLVALTVGAIYGCAVYLLLQRSLGKLVIGLALLSHGSHLLIFAAGGLTRGAPPIVPAPAPADPLPQALVLTAIVISFAVLAFALVLVRRTYEWSGTDDLDTLRHSEA
jgi:multicomponent Na+:H+ antiporter subunit C